MPKQKLALLLFFTFSLFFHKLAQYPFEVFVEWFDHILLKRILLFAGSAVLILLASFVVKRLQDAKLNRNVKLGWVIAFSGLIISSLTLMPYMAESMHYLQYAIMGSLALRAVRNPFEALCLTFLLGAGDELFQYMIGWSIYYDFNDIVLNFFGAYIGILFSLTFNLFSFSTHRAQTISAYPILLLSFGTGLILTVGLGSGVVCFFTDTDCYLHLCVWDSSRLSSEFWDKLDWGDVWHRIRPMPGALSFIILPLLGWPLRRL